MLFNNAIAAAAGLLAVVPSALATITITGPSSNAYWVQGKSNQITWTFNSGDPNPISIVITNPNNTFLNGPFSIAEHVDLSNMTFTITNVTLTANSGYVVNFVNGTNQTQLYAQSGTFDVKPSGTAQVTQSTPTGSSPSATGTAPAGNGTGNGTATGGAGNSTGSGNNNNAARGTHTSVATMLGASVAFALLGVLTTL